MSKENKTISKRTMSLPKAIKIMQDYKRLNYNAYQTLKANGYSEKYALANARYTIEACSQKIKESLDIDTNTNSKDVALTTSNLYEAIGLSKQEVLNELVKIIKQDLNFAVKLRALEPFVRQEGIKWDEKETQQAQSVSIVLEKVDKPIEVREVEGLNVDK